MFDKTNSDLNFFFDLLNDEISKRKMNEWDRRKKMPVQINSSNGKRCKKRRREINIKQRSSMSNMSGVCTFTHSHKSFDFTESQRKEIYIVRHEKELE